MTEVPQTRDSLLIRVRDPEDREAWDQFACIYRPVVYRLARAKGPAGRGCPGFGAACAGVCRSRHSQLGAFRAWSSISPLAASSCQERGPQNLDAPSPRDQAGGGTSAMALLNAQPDSTGDAAGNEEREYRRQLIRRAAEIVRARAPTKRHGSPFP